MEVGAHLLSQPLVRGVAEQLVAEPKGVFSGEYAGIGSDELLSDQALERARDPLLFGLRRQLADGTPPEDPADHGSSSQDFALVPLEPVEPCGEQRVDRGRDGELAQVCAPLVPVTTQCAVFDQHPDDLLEEERISLCRPRDRVVGAGGRGVPAEQILYQPCRCLGVERLKQDRGGFRTRRQQ